MARDLEHPIWDVHDMRRTARLSVKYYCVRLVHLERKNFWMEVMLAITASGSAIAGLAFWNTELGVVAWQVLIVLSALLAVAKPLMKITDQIQRLESVVTGYRIVEHDLQKIEVAARQRKAYDEDLQNRFAAVLERMDALITKPSEYRTNGKLQRRCQEEVDRELPCERFYVPPESQNGT